MPLYIIRVELHQAPGEAYVELDRRLVDAGLGKSMISSEGAEYELPLTEYAYFGEETTAELRDAIKPHVAAVDPLFSVLVMRVDELSWYGLKKLGPADAARADANDAGGDAGA